MKTQTQLRRELADLEYTLSTLSHGEDGIDNEYERRLLYILIERKREEIRDNPQGELL